MTFQAIIPDESGEINFKRKFVIQENEDDFEETNIYEFQAFSALVEQLQDVFYVNNSKHNKIGYITGLCSEDKRWDYLELMKESLKNPKNDNGDD